MNLFKIRWFLCDWCNKGIWYEWTGPGPNDGTAEQCSCWKESWYSLIKGYIRVRIKILKKKLMWRNENVNEDTF
tara:strand:+ start:506 stop:727 length:222 start_codon:yes stop_codon:yes gene_type:complete